MRATSPFPTLHRTVDLRAAAVRTARTVSVLALAVIVVGAASQPAVAADDAMLERLATCKDSWFDWKDDRTRTTQFVSYLKTHLKSDDEGQSYKPVAPLRLFGLPVLEAYPQSIGMGVGFSVLLDVDLATARKIIEKQIGRSMQCKRSDGMDSCGFEIGAERTVTLLANIRPDKPTLAGCYYFYQQ